MNIEKIDKKVENGAFEMAFRSGNWGLNPEQVLPIFQALIKRHNDVVDVVNKLSIHSVSNRLLEMEEAGKEATSLIAHLKDQHGFNDEEQASQDKIMNVFKYEGRW